MTDHDHSLCVLADGARAFCLATGKPGPCVGQKRGQRQPVYVQPKLRTVPTAPVRDTAGEARRAAEVRDADNAANRQQLIAETGGLKGRQGAGVRGAGQQAKRVAAATRHVQAGYERQVTREQRQHDSAVKANGKSTERAAATNAKRKEAFDARQAKAAAKAKPKTKPKTKTKGPVSVAQWLKYGVDGADAIDFWLGEFAGKKPGKCKYCQSPATKGVRWAEGMARIPVCDEHLAKAKATVAREEGPGGIVGVDEVKGGQWVRHIGNYASVQVDESYVPVLGDDDTTLFALYGLERALSDDLYRLADPAHDRCNIGDFCRNPLHPGPCKGWKHMLHSVSPAAYHAMEKARVDKLNANRKAKIAALEAAGKKVPAYLKKEATYAQTPTAPEGSSYKAPTPEQAKAALPPTMKEIEKNLHGKHAAKSAAVTGNPNATTKQKVNQHLLLDGEAMAKLPPATQGKILSDLAKAEHDPDVSAEVKKAAAAKLHKLADAAATGSMDGKTIAHAHKLNAAKAAGKPAPEAPAKPKVDNPPGYLSDKDGDGDGKVYDGTKWEKGTKHDAPKSRAKKAADAIEGKSTPAGGVPEGHHEDLHDVLHDKTLTAHQKITALPIWNSKAYDKLPDAQKKQVTDLLTHVADSPAYNTDQKLDATLMHEKLTGKKLHAIQQTAEQHVAIAGLNGESWNESHYSADMKAKTLGKLDKKTYDALNHKQKARADEAIKQLEAANHPDIAGIKAKLGLVQTLPKDAPAGGVEQTHPDIADKIKSKSLHISDNTKGLPKEARDTAPTAAMGFKFGKIENGKLYDADGKLIGAPMHDQGEKAKGWIHVKTTVPSASGGLRVVAVWKPADAPDAPKATPAGVAQAAEVKPAGKLTPTGKTLGTHGANVQTDEAGKEWLVKPTKAGEAMIPQAEKVVSLLSNALGLKTPVVHVQPDGSSVQEMVPGAKPAFPGAFDPKSLTLADVLAVQKHHVLDWLTGQHDAHKGNWLKGTDGTLVEIDKGQAFKHYGTDKLASGYHPNKAFGEDDPVYNHLLKAAAKGDVQLHDPQSGELGAFVKSVQGIPDADLKAMFRPYAEAAAKEGKLPVGGTVNGFLDKVIARKNNLAKAFTDLHEAEGIKHDPVLTAEYISTKTTADLGIALPDAGDEHPAITKLAEANTAYQKFQAVKALTKDEYKALPADQRKQVADALNQVAGSAGLWKANAAAKIEELGIRLAPATPGGPEMKAKAVALAQLLSETGAKTAAINAAEVKFLNDVAGTPSDHNLVKNAAKMIATQALKQHENKHGKIATGAHYDALHVAVEADVLKAVDEGKLPPAKSAYGVVKDGSKAAVLAKAAQLSGVPAPAAKPTAGLADHPDKHVKEALEVLSGTGGEYHSPQQKLFFIDSSITPDDYDDFTPEQKKLVVDALKEADQAGLAKAANTAHHLGVNLDAKPAERKAPAGANPNAAAKEHAAVTVAGLKAVLADPHGYSNKAKLDLLKALPKDEFDKLTPAEKVKILNLAVGVKSAGYPSAQEVLDYLKKMPAPTHVNAPAGVDLDAPHVKAAIEWADGTAKTKPTSTKHLEAYSQLSAEEYQALTPVQRAVIQAHLLQAVDKFLDPKKKTAAQETLDKLTGPVSHTQAPAPAAPDVLADLVNNAGSDPLEAHTKLLVDMADHIYSNIGLKKPETIKQFLKEADAKGTADAYENEVKDLGILIGHQMIKQSLDNLGITEEHVGGLDAKKALTYLLADVIAAATLAGSPDGAKVLAGLNKAVGDINATGKTLADGNGWPADSDAIKAFKGQVFASQVQSEAAKHPLAAKPTAPAGAGGHTTAPNIAPVHDLPTTAASADVQAVKDILDGKVTTYEMAKLEALDRLGGGDFLALSPAHQKQALDLVEKVHGTTTKPDKKEVAGKLLPKLQKAKLSQLDTVSKEQFLALSEADQDGHIDAVDNLASSPFSEVSTPAKALLAKYPVAPKAEHNGMKFKGGAVVKPAQDTQFPVKLVVPSGHEQKVQEHLDKIAASAYLDLEPLEVPTIKMKEMSQKKDSTPTGKAYGTKYSWSSVWNAYRAYTGSYYDGINDLLRGSKGKETGAGTSTVGKSIRAMDAVYAHPDAKLKKPITMLRGFRNPAGVFKDAWLPDKSMVGVEFTEHGYTSSTTRMNTARQFSGADYGKPQDSVIMRIYAPAGTPAVTAHTYSSHPGEEEIVLGRGMQYRIVADHGYQNGARHIDVEIVL